MPSELELKAVDPDAEFNNAQRMFLKLAPECSAAKRAAGTPQLAPQEKQMSILKAEMRETQLCVKIAKKGRHALRDISINKRIKESIIEYENWDSVLRNQQAQDAELDLMNHLAQKNIYELSKELPSEADELNLMENANQRLSCMENRLDLANKKFCVVNADNKRLREEIHRLLVERNNFNVEWKRTIRRLMKGKEYLMDVMEVATAAFGNRDKACRVLHSLKWKGLYQLNRDIAEMQYYDSEINHLAKLEEFLRVKGSNRICESDENEEIKRQEELIRSEQEMARLHDMLDEIFMFAGTDNVHRLIQKFKRTEIENYSQFLYLCEVMQETTALSKDLDALKQKILDQHDINQARQDMQERRLADLSVKLAAQQNRTQRKMDLNTAADAKFNKLLKGFDELIRIANCDTAPLLSLLGNNLEVNKWNVDNFLKILECEVKSLIQVVYGAVKPPARTPVKTKGVQQPVDETKLIADPYVEILRPNKLESLVPYQPCAYCVEDYIMNFVYETPAVPADQKYIDDILHLEEVNTKFGIYTLTVPTKRHPYRNKNKGD